MAQRKPKARHAGMRIAVFLSKEEALAEDRNGQIALQNFEHTMTGLNGLDALDAENDFEDGDVIAIPCYIRVCKNKGYTAPVGRKVTVLRDEAETVATSDSAEDLPLS